EDGIRDATVTGVQTCALPISLRRAWQRLLGTFSGGRRENELAAELEAHIEMQAEDNVRLGMSPEEARRAALLKFGGVESTKEHRSEERRVGKEGKPGGERRTE